MTPPADDPSQNQRAAPAAPKKTRIPIAWTRGARLLGSGQSPESVAAALGIEEERLWRHLKASRRFRRLLDESLNLHGFSAGLQAVLSADRIHKAE